MSNVPDPPPTVNTMRTIGIVWAVVGALAIVGGAVATVFAVVLFGILAVIIGVGLYAVQQVRANSAERSARTLSNSPPPPVSSPGAGPGSRASADDPSEWGPPAPRDDPPPDDPPPDGSGPDDADESPDADQAGSAETPREHAAPPHPTISEEGDGFGGPATTGGDPRRPSE